MRKIILFHHASLDGFVAGPNGEMDWISFDEELMAGFWPNLPESLLESKYHVEQAQWLENATKIVFSKSLNKVDWKNSKLLQGNFAEEISSLKQQSGKDMILIGSASLAHSLMQLGLIDEYRININPVVLGGGTPLFKNITDRFNLKLEQTCTFLSGVVSLVYQTPGIK